MTPKGKNRGTQKPVVTRLRDDPALCRKLEAKLRVRPEDIDPDGTIGVPRAVKEEMAQRENAEFKRWLRGLLLVLEVKTDTRKKRIPRLKRR